MLQIPFSKPSHWPDPTLPVTSTLSSAAQDNYRRFHTPCGDIHVGPQIGQGGFGKVFLSGISDGQHLRLWAVKELSTQKAVRIGYPPQQPDTAAHEKLRTRALHEVAMLQKAKSKLIPHLFFENTELQSFFLVQPLMLGTIADCLGALPPICTQSPERLNFAHHCLSLLSALRFMHDEGVSHRDIKPSNLFYAPDGSLFFGDFGLATTHRKPDFPAGCAPYMAPEVLNHAVHKRKGEPAESYSLMHGDLFSFGVILLEILLGENPFGITSSERKSSSSKDALYACIQRKHQNFKSKTPWLDLSQQTRTPNIKFVSHREPVKDYDLFQPLYTLFDNPEKLDWHQTLIEEISTLLSYAPSYRSSAKTYRLFDHPPPKAPELLVQFMCGVQTKVTYALRCSPIPGKVYQKET